MWTPEHMPRNPSIPSVQSFNRSGASSRLSNYEDPSNDIKMATRSLAASIWQPNMEIKKIEPYLDPETESRLETSITPAIQPQAEVRSAPASEPKVEKRPVPAPRPRLETRSSLAASIWQPNMEIRKIEPYFESEGDPKTETRAAPGAESKVEKRHFPARRPNPESRSLAASILQPNMEIKKIEPYIDPETETLREKRSLAASIWQPSSEIKKIEPYVETEEMASEHSRRSSVSSNVFAGSRHDTEETGTWSAASTAAEDRGVRVTLDREIAKHFEIPLSQADSMFEGADAKTPTAMHTAQMSRASTLYEEPAGPLGHLLLSALSKINNIEKDRPTVMAEEFAEMERRVTGLVAEKEALLKRHEALYALRDEDLANLIKIRGLLAAERRAHDSTKRLRDEDLENVISLRGKLAQATWTAPAAPAAPAIRHASPSRSLERRATKSESISNASSTGSDLWHAAKTAAMEQKVLELEENNKNLRAQLAASSNISNTSNMSGMSRIEAMFEDSIRHRERMASKMQALRCERESLQRELAASEDRNNELEGIVERLQRRQIV